LAEETCIYLSGAFRQPRILNLCRMEKGLT